MTNDESNPNAEIQKEPVVVCWVRHSGFDIPSAFDIRASSFASARCVSQHRFGFARFHL